MDLQQAQQGHAVVVGVLATDEQLQDSVQRVELGRPQNAPLSRYGCNESVPSANSEKTWPFCTSGQIRILYELNIQDQVPMFELDKDADMHDSLDAAGRGAPAVELTASEEKESRVGSEFQATWLPDPADWRESKGHHGAQGACSDLAEVIWMPLHNAPHTQPVLADEVEFSGAGKTRAAALDEPSLSLPAEMRGESAAETGGEGAAAEQRHGWLASAPATADDALGDTNACADKTSPPAGSTIKGSEDGQRCLEAVEPCSGGGGGSRTAGSAVASVAASAASAGGASLETAAIESARFLRRWSSAEMEAEALHALWRAGGDTRRADAAMAAAQHAAGGGRSAAEEAARAGRMALALIEHRKDVRQAQRALVAGGLAVSIGQLLCFFYGAFRQSDEYKVLSAGMEAIMEQEDRFDDFCSVCLDRGFLLCCEGCSAAFHLSCVNLSAVPEGEWQCPACVAAAEWDRYGDALLSGRGRRRAEARGALRGGRGSGRADSERSADKGEEQMGLKAQPQASMGSGDAGPSADEREEAGHRSGGAAPVKALGTGVRRPRELQPTTTSRTVEYKPGSLPPHWWCEERRTSRHRYRVFHGPGGVSAPSRLIAWRRHTGGSEVEAAAAMAAAVAEVAEAAGAAGAAESAGVIVAERFVASVSAASRCVSAQSSRAASDSDETSDARQAELLARETDSVASGSGNASSAQTCAASATGAEAAAEGAEPSLAAAAIPSRHAAKRRRADEDAPRPASRSGGVRRAHRTLAGRD